MASRRPQREAFFCAKENEQANFFQAVTARSPGQVIAAHPGSLKTPVLGADKYFKTGTRIRGFCSDPGRYHWGAVGRFHRTMTRQTLLKGDSE